MMDPARSVRPKKGVRMSTTAKAPRANCPKDSTLPRMKCEADWPQMSRIEGNVLPSMIEANTMLIMMPGTLRQTSRT